MYVTRASYMRVHAYMYTHRNIQGLVFSNFELRCNCVRCNACERRRRRSLISRLMIPNIAMTGAWLSYFLSAVPALAGVLYNPRGGPSWGRAQGALSGVAQWGGRDPIRPTPSVSHPSAQTSPLSHFLQISCTSLLIEIQVRHSVKHVSRPLYSDTSLRNSPMYIAHLLSKHSPPCSPRFSGEGV